MAMQLKSVQRSGQGNCGLAIEELTTQNANEIVTTFEELKQNDKEIVARQLKSLQPNGHRSCNMAHEELTLQTSRKLKQCSCRTHKEKVQGNSSIAVETLTTQMSRNI